MAAPGVGTLVKAYLQIQPGTSVLGGFAGGITAALTAGMGLAGRAGGTARSGMGYATNAGVHALRTGTLTFKFNPKDYTISKSAQYATTPNPRVSEAPASNFTGAGPRELSLTLFFDETDSVAGNVARDVDVLMSCCNAPRSGSLPPVVLFGWGTNVTFMAAVMSVSAQFTLFRPDGTPIRATASVSLREHFNPNPVRPGNPTSGTPDIHRARTVVAGDTLASIAYQEHGDATRWRAIADLNDVDDPLSLRSGSSLLVPERAGC